MWNQMSRNQSMTPFLTEVPGTEPAHLAAVLPSLKECFCTGKNLNTKLAFVCEIQFQVRAKPKKYVCRQYRQIVKEERKKTYWRYPLAFLWFENHSAFNWAVFLQALLV